MINNTKTLIEFIMNNYIDKVTIAVDMTCGNGNDSKYILDSIKPKMLYAFDIQEEAKTQTERLLSQAGLGKENFKFILDSHENIDKYIDTPVNLAIYNLGYLPKGDHTITTKSDQVLASLKKLLKMLSIGGKIVFTFYPGHEEGKKEATEITEFLEALDQRSYTILKFDFINQINNPPFVVMVEKR